MTGRADLLAEVEQAEQHVHNARRNWNPTSLEHCAGCIQELQDAVAAMESAQRVASQAAGSPEVKARLEHLRTDLETLSRAVDATLAFCRGMALRTGQPEPEQYPVEG